ncbi:hypothetical protein Pedsa_0824 [Pseudopedobacter saltans DSM 12145]|uniref:O-antigen polymerase n=1 Tax=Pseudopedobacter saltans (strain ATCC 51119 / DSM 12145 / JCM 21818 / CCUG 39354 / LMG 10337 / NBRC 100064 / NCIMB 13643) TaxID=762903 RepID=F0S9P0_PSESL|nr:hypothetical protein [Pseudopedobacter saltans]ADY51396.1 hypothetical protein Pedsa_0824 [Pseudopedobacter saltans DSM 12145]
MKYIVFLLMVLYLYVLTYGIFMTETFRLPAPVLFGIPLVILFNTKVKGFAYTKELIALLIAVFFYYVIGLQELETFASYAIGILMCSLFFNYFIGNSGLRFRTSVFIFYTLLLFSAVVMVMDHIYPGTRQIRELLVDDKVVQSPSGIAVYQFTFGYQIAALTPFLFIYTILYQRSFLLKSLVLVSCLGFLYLGMQRSAFVAFLACVLILTLLYYRHKALVIWSLGALVGMLFYTLVLKDNTDERNNIFAKNANDGTEFNRSGLALENINIYSDYPLGLIFYGKNWGDVIYRNPVFSSGITSHNAYLMFITYLGPIVGLTLLWIIYAKVLKISFLALKRIRDPDNALLICLCFSFLGVSINSLSHNAWLISADGPTLFLYFSILHLYRMKNQDDFKTLTIT